MQRRRLKQAPVVIRTIHAVHNTPQRFPNIPLKPLPSLEKKCSPSISAAPQTAFDMIVVPSASPSPPVGPSVPPPSASPSVRPPPFVLPDPVPGFCTVTCPHCLGGVLVHPSERNCAILRHGAFRNSGQPIPPHATKREIDTWIATKAIWGCGGPFRLTSDTTAEKCDYI